MDSCSLLDPRGLFLLPVSGLLGDELCRWSARAAQIAPTCREGTRKHLRAPSDSQGPGLQLGLKQRPSLMCLP